MMTFHIAVDSCNIGGIENATFHDMVDDPLDTADMFVALLLRRLGSIGRWIEAQEIEAYAVGHYVGTMHSLTLLLAIAIFQIEGVVRT